MKLALPDDVLQRLQQLRLSGENLQDVGCAGYSGEFWQHSFNVIANAIIIFHQYSQATTLWGSAACAIPATTDTLISALHRRVLTRHARHESRH